MQHQVALAFLLAIQLSGAEPEGCPSGWVNSLEGCFLFHYTSNITWRDAQEECEKMGGFLAEIKTEEQAMLLVRRQCIQGVHKQMRLCFINSSGPE